MNTGNIARTCAATNSRLHLIKPLGFDISEKAVKRAGLDYWHLLDLTVYENLDDFFSQHPEADLWLATSRGDLTHDEATFRDDCYLFFGKETAGLPEFLLERYPDRCLRLPMVSEARSLNLANAVAVVTYEALRQLHYPGLDHNGRQAWNTQKSTAIRR